MPLTGLLRAAWIAVPVALVCGGAVAQQIITIPPGIVLVVTPGATTAPALVERQAALPSIERLFAEQQAMMDRMMAGMNAAFSPVPGGIFPALLGPGAMPAGGGTFCSESVSISYYGNSAPVVKVSRSGTGCGPETGAAPMPAETSPPAADHPNVIEVNDPAPVTAPKVRHHT